MVIGKWIRLYLHSIMYLLIRCFFRFFLFFCLFTFHNVSINSVLWKSFPFFQINLHSIMYLLILVNGRYLKNNIISNLHSIMYLLILRGHPSDSCAGWSFTFHNVSINSEFQTRWSIVVDEFTFHNVSINSQRQIFQQLPVLIYIP